MKRYAIIGHPVSHALSPRLHTAAFRALGLDCTYEAIDIAPDELPRGLQSLRDEGFAGFNVTVPHKEAVLSLLDGVDEAARKVGAVNTVINNAGKLLGTNTDVFGFTKLAEPFADAINRHPVAVLGAGGSARAVLFGLTSAFTPARITILNRTIERAERLASEFTTEAVVVKPEPLFQDELEATIHEASVVVNTTSVGMKPFVDATPLEDVKLKGGQVIIDLIYTPPETALLKAARAAGATGANGLDMLLHQAAGAFRLWTGKEMPMEEVRKELEG